MHQSYLSSPSNLAQRLEEERPRLLRLCTGWLGNRTVAEDVVQETLLEAWLKIESLRDPQAFQGWLSGIARNMSLRRLRREGRDLALPHAAHDPAQILSRIPAPFDFEVELDRADLARLLEQALALLPPETRSALIQRYVDDASHRAIAERLGVSENVVAVRLHRGKLALRKVLAAELQDDAAAFGLLTAGDAWQQTRIWCTHCGQRPLMGKLNEDEFALRCPDCNDEPGSYHSQSSHKAGLDTRFKTFRPALKYFLALMDDLFQRARQQGAVPCTGCGQLLPLRHTVAPYAPPSVRAKRGLHVYCPDCDSGSYETLEGLALHLAPGIEFFKAHPRIHTLPQREIEHGGLPALVVSLAAVGGSATYDVILKRDTYEPLAIHSNAA